MILGAAFHYSMNTNNNVFLSCNVSTKSDLACIIENPMFIGMSTYALLIPNFDCIFVVAFYMGLFSFFLLFDYFFFFQ